MRDLPVTIHRVAAEAAADVIEQAAICHARQRQGGHEERLDVGFGVVGTGTPAAQQVVDGRGVRELRRRAEPPVFPIERPLEPCTRRLERL